MKVNGATSNMESRSYRPGLVSIIIPTLNSERTLERCLRSIQNQSYDLIETIVVDGFSRDGTLDVARKCASKVFLFGPDQTHEFVFGAPYQRNFGASVSTGEFVYYVDADMELTPDVIKACVSGLVRLSADAVIVPEMSRGDGFWGLCKALERRCYMGNDLAEAPRFFRSKTWNDLEGLDPKIGGDDWDIYHRLRGRGLRAIRVQDYVVHHEGRITLRRLALKRYVYGKNLWRFFGRHKSMAQRQLFPIRSGYLHNRNLLAHFPIQLAGIGTMRGVEYLACAAGMLIGRVAPPRPRLVQGKEFAGQVRPTNS